MYIFKLICVTTWETGIKHFYLMLKYSDISRKSSCAIWVASWTSCSFMETIFIGKNNWQTMVIQTFSKRNKVSLLLQGKQLAVCVASDETGIFRQMKISENLYPSLWICQSLSVFSHFSDEISDVTTNVTFKIFIFYIYFHIKRISIWKICTTHASIF